MSLTPDALARRIVSEPEMQRNVAEAIRFAIAEAKNSERDTSSQTQVPAICTVMNADDAVANERQELEKILTEVASLCSKNYVESFDAAHLAAFEAYMTAINIIRARQ